jgi:hypothetical protein
MRFALLMVLFFSVIVVQGSEIDTKTGLVIAPGFEVVSVQCTVCHSALLVTQNRASREGWLSMIRWMQETQGLWPLGEQELVVLDYLAEHYGPQHLGRRPLLPAHLLPPLAP